jgi:ATP-dependent Lhr-like helicase
VFGLGPHGERLFGRRHFSDLVVSFSSPMLLTVYLGQTELGAVHPLAVTPPRNGGQAVVLLAGRSWQVMEVDWPRRRVSVAPARDTGRARWLGSSRPALRKVCRAAEAVVAGAEPTSTLSRRARERLDAIRERLAFVDGHAVPIVSDGEQTTRIWTFAGGLANTAIAEVLEGPAVRSDDFAITLDARDPGQIAETLERIAPATLQPSVSAEAVRELKFSECLDAGLAAAILQARLTDREGVNETLSRPRRFVRDVVEP